jgi:MerR family mercuric resistance operon transcriptional regulator
VHEAEHLRTLAFIRRGRELGFTPDEVRALLELRRPGKASCCEVQEIAAHHLDRVRAKIADLTRLERLLAGTIKQCSGEAAPECPVLDMIDHTG